MIQIQCIGTRAHTNSLPLALVPIMNNPKTEGSSISFMFRPSQLLGQWIYNIALFRNLANLDISSLDDLSNEMVPPEYAFGPLV